MENPFKKYFTSENEEKEKKRWVVQTSTDINLMLTCISNYSETRSNFKKFDYADDEDEIFDLDDLFSEFQGNSFNFDGFPPNILKQFQEIMEAMQEFDEDPQNRQRQKLFENKYNEFRQKTDQDLDGQLYADQLDTLIKRISPESIPKDAIAKASPKKVKVLDEDKIFDIIHGTFPEEIVPVRPRKRQVQKIPASPHHFGGLPPFDLPPSSGRTTWGQTVMTIRKQDGSSETRKMERTPNGQTKTTITKTDSDGSSSTQTFTGEGQKTIQVKSPQASANYAERNLITFDGYKIPCLW